MRKMIKGIAAVLAVSALMAGSAFAADKLVVRNDSNTADVFKVQGDGNIVTTGGLYHDGVNKRVGIGTSTPTTALHVASEDGGNALRGLTDSQHNNGAQGAVINFVKSRGTQASPALPTTGEGTGDYIGAFVAQYWNGTAYDRSSQFAFRNDVTGYAVSGSNVFPTMIIFQTGASTIGTDPNIMTERFRISSKGNIVTGNKGGTATVDMATNVTDGFLYIPNVAGTLSTCASATTYAGHVPVWFDTVSSKICTCQAGALKCTAALN